MPLGNKPSPKRHWEGKRKALHYLPTWNGVLCFTWQYIDGLVQERCNSSALALELHLSCTNPSSHSMTLTKGELTKHISYLTRRKSYRMYVCRIQEKIYCCTNGTANCIVFPVLSCSDFSIPCISIFYGSSWTMDRAVHEIMAMLSRIFCQVITFDGIMGHSLWKLDKNND